jgi:hypothetical protein
VGDTSERTSEILNAMSEAIESYKKEVDTKIHAHRLDLMEHSEAENIPSSGGIDEGSYSPRTQIQLTDGQSNLTDRNYVAEVQRQFSDNQSNLTNQIATLYDRYTALSDREVSAESSKGVTMSQALKGGIKFGIIGMILGIFLSAGFIVFKAILEDKIFSSSEIPSLFGLRVFGDYKSGANNAFDKALYKLSYGDALPDKEKFYEVAAANVKTFVTAFKDEDIKEISMVGKIDSEVLKTISKSINDINGDETVKAAGDVISDAEAINAIKDVKYTLIAIDRNTAKKDLRSLLEKLKGLNKSVAGVLLFD